jgi:phytol kinase
MTVPSLPSWLGIVVIAGCACGMLVALEVYRRISHPSPEWLRKLAHIGTGILSLALPWVFRERWPVFAVCVLSAALLLTIRRSHRLHDEVGNVLHGVSRETFGELYFPISVAILYGVSHGDKVLYSIPILLLTLADTTAALTGVHYGKHEYEGTGAHKSLEGSAVFFTVAFLTVHIPLLLFTEVGRGQSLLIAGTMGLLVMLLEAISWRGIDNIFIPLGGFILLKIYLKMPVEVLLARFLVAFLILVAVILYRRWTTLQASGLLSAALVLYVAWAVGGWIWLLAPATLLAVYSLLAPPRPNEARIHNVFAVISVSFAGLLWLFLSKIWPNTQFLYPYSVAFASHLTILTWTLSCTTRPECRPGRVLPLYVLKSWFLIFLPFVAVNRFTSKNLFEVGVALPLIAMAVALFAWLQPRDGRYPLDADRWMRQAELVGLSSGVALLLVL